MRRQRPRRECDPHCRATVGFTLVELLVALALLSLSLLGVARVLQEASVHAARAVRLSAALDALDCAAASGAAAAMRGPSPPTVECGAVDAGGRVHCSIVATPVGAPGGTVDGLVWTWVRVDCGSGARGGRLVVR